MDSRIRDSVCSPATEWVVSVKISINDFLDGRALVCGANRFLIGCNIRIEHIAAVAFLSVNILAGHAAEGVVAEVEILLADLGDGSCDGRSDAIGPCKIAIRYEHEFAPDTNGREPELVLHSIVLLFVES